MMGGTSTKAMMRTTATHGNGNGGNASFGACVRYGSLGTPAA
jgi:hypothetical protein